MTFTVSNFYVSGLERAVKASGNPMRTALDVSAPDDKDFLRAARLGSAHPGEGHDTYLKGITVLLDVTAPLYWWKEAQRYHYFEFVSSESTMHSLLKFDVAAQCVVETDPQILNRVQELRSAYLSLPDDEAHKAAKTASWRVLVASLPEGFCLGATMVTNYLQLKTIYLQRHDHKLEEWRRFCAWILSLPHFAELTGIKQEKNQA